MVELLGVRTRLVRDPEDLAGLTHLIMPGGESTTFFLLSRKYGLLDPLRECIADGLPVFGTCAGAILLGCGDAPPPRFSAVPVEVVRNAYGRQKESFTADVAVSFCDAPFRGVFIRAPKFSVAAEAEKDPELKVLGKLGDEPVLLEYRRILLASFHPELTGRSAIHRYFLG